MSLDKNLGEAERWLLTAEDDLDTAKLLRDSGRHAHACFHAQQAGEKAVKAVWYGIGQSPWGHSTQKLIQDLESADGDAFRALSDMMVEAAILDRFYIPTRYPNGLPDLTPSQTYFREDADTAIEKAVSLIQAARGFLKGLQNREESGQ